MKAKIRKHRRLIIVTLIGLSVLLIGLFTYRSFRVYRSQDDTGVRLFFNGRRFYITGSDRESELLQDIYGNPNIGKRGRTVQLGVRYWEKADKYEGSHILIPEKWSEGAMDTDLTQYSSYGVIAIADDTGTAVIRPDSLFGSALEYRFERLR